jgi:DNA-binding response OmpR family regulator
MAIERAILDNIQRAAKEGNWDQIRLAEELAAILNNLREQGFEDYPVNSVDTKTNYNYEYNSQAGIVVISGESVRLTKMEGKLLSLLSETPNTIFTPHELKTHMGKPHIQDDSIEKLVQRTRLKIEGDHNPSIRLANFHSRGYAFLNGEKDGPEIILEFDNKH